MYMRVYNIAGKDKSLKVAESLFRASEVVNSGGGGCYGFSLYIYIRVYYNRTVAAPVPRVSLRSGFYSVSEEKGLVCF